MTRICNSPASLRSDQVIALGGYRDRLGADSVIAFGGIGTCTPSELMSSKLWIEAKGAVEAHLAPLSEHVDLPLHQAECQRAQRDE